MGDVGPPPRRVGAIVGLPQEAAILKRVLGKSAPPILCGGAQAAGAARAATELVAADGAMRATRSEEDTSEL